MVKVLDFHDFYYAMVLFWQISDSNSEGMRQVQLINSELKKNFS